MKRLFRSRTGIVPTVICAVLALFASLFAPLAHAQGAAPVRLSGPVETRALLPYIVAHVDDDWSRTVPEMLAAGAGLFEPIKGDRTNFGYIDGRVWLRFDLVNEASRSDWILMFGENFMQDIDVLAARSDGTVETLLDLDLTSGFDARPIADPRLAAPLSIGPGERVTILVRFWSGGLSTLSPSIQTPARFAALASERTARDFAFYGMTFAMVLMALLALPLVRSSVFVAYAAYTGSTLFYLTNADGTAFQYLWPNAPGFNDVASVIAGSAMFAFALIYTRSFLVTRERYPRVDRLLLLAIAAVAGLALMGLFGDRQLSKQLLSTTAAPAIVLLMIGAGLVAARDGRREVRFFLLAWIGAFLAAGITSLRHVIGLEIGRELQYDITRFWIVLDALLMGLAVVDRINQERRAGREAMRANLEHAQRNLRLNERLRDLEDTYARSEDLAREQDERIRETVHDLRQPLSALRLNLRELIGDERAPAAKLARVETNFAYVEQLVSEQLENARAQASTAATAEAPLVPDGPDANHLDLNGVLAAIHDMFAADAAEKGLRLHYAPSRARTSVPALVLMRCVSNVLSNAVKYTAAGGVELRAQRKGEQVFIDVSDTGTGLTAEQFALARKRSERLIEHADTVEGQGLGLAIVDDLLARHGGSLSLVEPEGARGSEPFTTTVRIALPAAAIPREPDPPERVPPDRTQARAI